MSSGAKAAPLGDAVVKTWLNIINWPRALAATPSDEPFFSRVNCLANERRVRARDGQVLEALNKSSRAFSTWPTFF